MSYKVTNVQGNLLASGPLAVSPSAPVLELRVRDDDSAFGRAREYRDDRRLRD